MNPERGMSFAQAATKLIPEQYRNTFLLKMAEIGYQMIDFQDPELNLDRFALESRGKVGIIAANHRSHADGGVLVEAARRVNRRNSQPSKFILPIAASIDTGHQEDTIEAFFKAQKLWFQSNNIEPLDIVRDKDMEEYKLPRDREALRKFLSGMVPDGKYAMFPEAHVTGGRINPALGERNNAIEVDNDSIQTIVEKSLKKGLEVVFINVGIEGTENIFDNTEGAQRIPNGTWINIVPTVVGVGRKLAVARVGSTYTSTDIFNAGISIKDSKAINAYVMGRFKDLISDEAMGFYGRLK